MGCSHFSVLRKKKRISRSRLVRNGLKIVLLEEYGKNGKYGITLTCHYLQISIKEVVRNHKKEEGREEEEKT